MWEDILIDVHVSLGRGEEEKKTAKFDLVPCIISILQIIELFFT